MDRGSDRRFAPSRRLARRSWVGCQLVALAALLIACYPAGTVRAGEPALGEHVMFGAYTFGGVWQGMEPVLSLESELGFDLAVVHWFSNWDTAYQPELVELVSGGGRVPLISWQPHHQSVRSIAAGEHDGYVRDWARSVAASGVTVYVRPFPEMNGYWTAWNGDAPELVRAWRRVVGIFREEGAHNVRWVYSPNVTDEPDVAGNRIEDYYPGADYVDVLALDGYNWGDARHYIGWRSFAEIFGGPYERLVALGDQPVWIAEVASTSLGGDKAGWVREMFATRGFGRVEAIVWFDEHKTVDWRIREHPEVVLAFRGALMSAQVASRPVGW